eukprot:1147331-Pelagomonas_calceolata.AAC.8
MLRLPGTGGVLGFCWLMRGAVLNMSLGFPNRPWMVPLPPLQQSAKDARGQELKGFEHKQNACLHESAAGIN